MSERAPSFGGEYVATPERVLLDEVRSAAYEVLYRPENELAREIAEKMLQKADIKDRVDEMYAHADDVTVRQELKKLGIFVVRESEAQFDYDDPEAGFSIRKGDSYLDLHIPPVPAELKSRDAVRDSLDLVRGYIVTQELDPKYVMGVTYGKMGKVANRVFGFDLSHPSPDMLPESIVGGVQRVYERFTDAGMDGKDMGLPVVVFKDTADFLES